MKIPEQKENLEKKASYKIFYSFNHRLLNCMQGFSQEILEACNVKQFNKEFVLLESNEF